MRLNLERIDLASIGVVAAMAATAAYTALYGPTGPVPVHMDIMTFEQAVNMVRPGIQRAKDYCAEMIAKGNWFAGCPAFLK